jgi:hypothetical protein
MVVLVVSMTDGFAIAFLSRGLRTLAILCATFLNGCALMPFGGDDTENIESATTVRLTGTNGTEIDWSVLDRRDFNKLFVSLTNARAFGLSIAGSMVLSPSAFLPDPTDYQKAAVQFLNQTDRSTCNIVSGTKKSQFQYEFAYDCRGASSVEPPKAAR